MKYRMPFEKEGFAAKANKFRLDLDLAGLTYRGAPVNMVILDSAEGFQTFINTSLPLTICITENPWEFNAQIYEELHNIMII